MVARGASAARRGLVRRRAAGRPPPPLDRAPAGRRPCGDGRDSPCRRERPPERRARCSGPPAREPGHQLMTARERMLAGELYDALDPELVEARAHARALLASFNTTGDQ